MKNIKSRNILVLVSILSAVIFVLANSIYASAGYITEEVSWKHGDINLVGTLYLPEGDGPFPAAIMLHGSGTLPRTDRIYKEHGERLGGAGLAFLVFDKRGVGNSSGNWREASLSDLAEDAVGGIEFLRRHQKINPKKIGLLGLSQGAWVATMIQARLSETAFMVWLSGTPLTPAEQGFYITEATLKKKNYDDETIRKAHELDKFIINVYRTNNGWDEATERINQVSGETWFKDSNLGLQAKDSWNWQWYRKFFDYDPLPELKNLKIPMFAVHGEDDPIMPVQKNFQILNELKAKGNKDIKTLLVPKVGHDLSIRRGPQPEPYWQNLVAWLKEKEILTR